LAGARHHGCRRHTSHRRNLGSSYQAHRSGAEEGERSAAVADPKRSDLSVTESASEPLLLAPPDAAGLLAVSPRMLRVLTHQGRVPCIRIGRLVRYSRRALEEWVAQQSYQAEVEESVVGAPVRLGLGLSSSIGRPLGRGRPRRG
jgi:excisionase family DNA binding protein